MGEQLPAQQAARNQYPDPGIWDPTKAIENESLQGGDDTFATELVNPIDSTQVIQEEPRSAMGKEQAAEELAPVLGAATDCEDKIGATARRMKTPERLGLKSAPPNPNDLELIALARSDSPRAGDAFYILFYSKQRMISSVLMSMGFGPEDAEDIIQITAIKAHKAFSRFRPEQKLFCLGNDHCKAVSDRYYPHA